MSLSFGQKNTEQKINQQTNPWAPTVPYLNNFLSTAEGQLKYGPTKAQTGAFTDLRNILKQPNPNAAAIGDVAGDTLGYESRSPLMMEAAGELAGRIDPATGQLADRLNPAVANLGGTINPATGQLETTMNTAVSDLGGAINPATGQYETAVGGAGSDYNRRLQPIADAEIDPMNNPAIKAILEDISNRENNRIAGVFAGQGRDIGGNASGQAAAARNITAASLPTVLAQYNADLERQRLAREGLHSAAVSDAGNILNAKSGAAKTMYDAGTNAGRTIYDAKTGTAKTLYDAETGTAKTLHDAGVSDASKVFDAQTGAITGADALDRSALATRAGGVQLSKDQLDALTRNPSMLLELEQQRKMLGMNDLNQYFDYLSRTAGLGGQTTGTSKGSQTSFGLGLNFASGPPAK